ncbi:conjugal transfer protein TraG N-terminal domain-containing protein [Persephonella sp.]
MKKIITFFLLIPAIALADETIYTWGYGDIMAHIIRSVKYIFVTNDYVGLFKIFAVIGLVLVLFSYLGKNTDPMALIKYYITSVAMYYLFISPTVFKTNIYIDDLNNNNYDQTITDVPALYAKVLSVFSILEKTTANLFETAFSLPDDLKYSNSGLLSAFGLMSNANSHRIIDTYLYLSINDYINDCVFPDIVDGTKDIYALARSSDLWTDLGGTSAARTTKYYSSSNPDGVIMTCTDAYNNITSTLNNYIINTGLPYLANFVGAYSSAQINNTLGVASQYYLDYAVTGQAYLRQSIAMNMFSEAFQNFARVNAISGTGLALGAAKVEETARNNMALSGVLGAKYIPVIKGILTALIAAFVPLLILLMVTPMFTRILIGFFMILFWLSLWHLGDVFINAIINVKASGFLQTAAGGEYNLLNKGVVDTSILDYINMVSSFYWAIPTISFMIASGFSIYAMNSLNQQMAGKVQGSTGGVAGEMATGSMDTSSKLNTGKQWNFSSFESGGFTSSYAMVHTANWGFTESVHQQKQGILGNESVNYDTSSIQRLNQELDKAIGYSGLNLGDGTIKNAIGRHDGNSFELHAGRMGDFQILKGSNFTVDNEGRISGKIEGRDLKGNMWTLEFSQGELVKATGVVDGKTVEWRHNNKEGTDIITYEIADGVKSSGLFTENGDYLASTAMPDKVSTTNEFSKSVNKKLAMLNRLSDAHSVQETFKSGTYEQRQSALNYAYKIGTDENYKGTEAQKYVQSKAYSALESTVKDLSAGGEIAITSGKKLDKEDMNQIFTEGKAGIEIKGGVPFVGELLEKLGLDAKFGFSANGGIKKAWVSKDSIYVETKDGSFYKFSLSEKAQEEFAKRFSEELSTDKTHSTGYSEGKDVSVQDNRSTTVGKEDFFQKVSQLAREDAKTLEQAKTYTEKEGTNVNKDLNRHLIDIVSDRTGKSWAEIQEEVNKNPGLLNKYLQDDEILTELSKRLTGDKNSLNFVKETQQQTQEINNQIEQDKKVLEAIASGDVNKIRQVDNHILAELGSEISEYNKDAKWDSNKKEIFISDFDNGYIDKRMNELQQQLDRYDKVKQGMGEENFNKIYGEQYNKIKDEYEQLSKMKHLYEQHQALQKAMGTYENIPEVEGKTYTEQDARNKANQEGMNKEYAYEAPNSHEINEINVEQDTQNAIKYGQDNVGLTNKIMHAKEELTKKYGNDIKSGLDIEQYRINEEVKKFNDKYGYNYSIEDIRTGKALAEVSKDVNSKVAAVEDRIKAYENLKNNEAIWSQLPEETKKSLEADYQKALQEKQELIKPITELANLQQRQQELHQDRLTYQQIQQYERTMPKIIYGEKPVGDGFFNNPDKEVNYPDYKPSTHSPDYSYGNRHPEAPSNANYPLGFDNNPGISNQEIFNKGKQVVEDVINTVENSQVVRDYREHKDDKPQFPER